jgi:drug/metabolite transporter (DMT)-like permease
MTFQSILLILFSAVIHAVWNLLSKRNRPTVAFFFAAVVASVVIYAPLGWALRKALALFPGQVWFLLALTGGFQALYYAGLAGAYRFGELSVSYPLARALPVLLVAGVSFVLGRGAQITQVGLLGMLFVAGGCWLVPQEKFVDFKFLKRKKSRAVFTQKNMAVLFAVLAALGTTGYTVIDDAALAILRRTPEILAACSGSAAVVSLLYAFVENCAILLWLAAVVLALPKERAAIRSFERRAWLTASLAGLLILAAYGLVLVAMAYVRDVSYIAAFRQLSIPLGAALGMAVQKEKAYPPKVLGIICIVCGLALVAVG